MKVKSLSRVRLFATPWTVAHQASPSMGFSKQEYWGGLPFPSPGDIPKEIKYGQSLWSCLEDGTGKVTFRRGNRYKYDSVGYNHEEQPRTKKAQTISLPLTMPYSFNITENQQTLNRESIVKQSQK